MFHVFDAIEKGIVSKFHFQFFAARIKNIIDILY